MFRGTFTALVTPFRDGAFDEAAYEQLIEWQIENGVAGIVPVGTTGESPTLDHDEHNRVIEIAVRCSAWAGESDRRHGLELHHRGDLAHAGSGKSRG